MIFSKEMYQYLAWKTLREVFGNSVEWSEEESKSIGSYSEECKIELTKKELNLVEARLRKMKNSYKENLLYSLEKMYWHELHDDYGSIYPPIEYDEETYSTWAKAVILRRTVKMTYDSTTSGLTERLVNPYKTSTPYGEGYCHLKKGLRKFRFDRIVEISLTDGKFIKPKDWKAQK